MKISKNGEILLSYVYYFIATFIALKFKLNYMIASVLFMVPVIIYLGIKLREHLKKNLIESLVIALSLGVIVDAVGHLSKSWYVPSVFDMKIFSGMPIDNVFWSILYVLLMIFSYVYFFDQYKAKKIDQNFKKASFLFLILLAVFVFSHQFFPSLLNIPYFYAILMVIFLAFTIFCLVEHPKLYKNVTLMALYLFIPSVLFEYVALELGYWGFEGGQHIGYMVVGKYSMPIEEFFFYFLAVTVTVLIYELFGDNKRNS